MMKTLLAIAACALAVAAGASPALALLPFQREWEAKYVAENKDAKFVEAAKAARCNVCHDANSKTRKDKNEYGKAVGKFLNKAEYDKIKKDAAAAKKYILEGFEKADAEKAADGKSYGEKIKAGKLPAGHLQAAKDDNRWTSETFPQLLRAAVTIGAESMDQMERYRGTWRAMRSP